jgi:hypothetical protein
VFRVRIRVVRLLRSPRSHLLSQRPSKRLFSPTNFYNSTVTVLDKIKEGKRNRSDEDSLEVFMNQWAHLYFSQGRY